MKLQINGELKVINTEEKEPNLAQVIKRLCLDPKLIVVEHNGSIINPKKWENQTINDGDILEIVTIVGGGT